MSPDPIVIAFNKTEDFRACLFDRFKDAASINSALNREKKRLRLRVIIAVSFAAHTLPRTNDIQQSSIFNLGINNRAPFYQATPPHPAKSINRQSAPSLSRKPASPDNTYGVLVLKSC